MRLEVMSRSQELEEAQVEDQQRTRAAGFDAHLVRPVDLDKLERALAGVTPGGYRPIDGVS